MIYVRRTGAALADESTQPYLVRTQGSVHNGVVYLIDRYERELEMPLFEFHRVYEPLTIERIYSWIEEQGR